MTARVLPPGTAYHNPTLAPMLRVACLLGGIDHWLDDAHPLQERPLPRDVLELLAAVRVLLEEQQPDAAW